MSKTEDYITGDMKERILMLNGGDQEAADSACRMLNGIVRSFNDGIRASAKATIRSAVKEMALIDDASPQ